MGKWSRRAFIGTAVVLGGGLAVGIGLGVAVAPGQRQRGIAGLATHTDEKLLQVWVKVAPDRIVTAILPHAEMGQGISTALPMMLADEMDADWDKVRWEAAPAHEEFANYALAEGFILDPMLGGKTLPGPGLIWPGRAGPRGGGTSPGKSGLVQLLRGDSPKRLHTPIASSCALAGS